MKKPETLKIPKNKVKMSVDELVAEYDRLSRQEKHLTELLNTERARHAKLRAEHIEVYAKLRKYESMAGIEVQASLHVNLRQLQYAFAGAKEQIGQLQKARDASLALVEAALKGADPNRVTEAARRLAATGSAVGIDIPNALPEGKKPR